MQLTVYYNKDDEWLIEKLKAYAYAERKSVSAVVLSALQAYFEEGEPPLGATEQKGQKPRR
jgi:hypothetical protein